MAHEPPEIRLLGELTVRRGGKVLPLPASKKTRALLGYLVATRGPHGRERLCDLLWEGPDDPRGALRWSLSKLRPLLNDGAAERLTADREHVGFSACGARIDLDDVKALQATGFAAAPLGALEAAAARWTGHFLEGLDLPGCVQFYAWCIAEREQARALHVAVLDALIARLQETPEQALRHARALVALDPLAESSHAKVIRLLAALGRTKDAIAEFDRCRRTLAEQIGARPSAELEHLRAELQPRRLEVDPPAPASSRPATVERAQPTLVGRAREQEALASLLSTHRAEATPNALLLVGESGMGKTRLLEELASRATARGAQVLSARAYETEGVRPYGLWVDALRAVPRAELARQPELKLLFPELGVPTATPDRTRLFEAVRGVLLRLAPVVVILDDLQWMDEGSGALLHFVARALAGHQVVLGCGARAGALGDNPAALGVVRALERHGRLERLVLAPLDDAQTEALARQLFPSVDGARVVTSAEGNPLYALELTRALERGEADPDTGLNRLARDRLDALSEPEQAVLPWAAALGRTFDVSVLTRVSGLPAAALLDSLERLERHGVLHATTLDLYDFAHDLLRQAAYTLMSEPRRRLVHRQIATALHSTSDALASDVAQHAALAGDHELAASACVAAGRRCWRLCAWGDAREIVRRGLEHAARLPATVRLPLEVELLGLMPNQREAGLRHELDVHFEQIARQAEALGLTAVVAQAFHYRSLALFHSGDFDAAQHHIGLAARTAAANDSAVLRGARCLALLEREMGEVKARLTELSSRPMPAEAELDFHWAWGLVHRFEGDSVRAAVELGTAAAVATRLERHWERGMIFYAAAVNHLGAGRFPETLECSKRLAEVAARLGDGAEGPVAQALAALVESHAGAAWGPLDAALEAVQVADDKAALATLANLAAEQAEERGETARADVLARRALAAATAVGQVSQQVLARVALLRRSRAGGSAAAAAELEALSVSEEPGRSARARAALHAAVSSSVKSPATKG